MCLNPPLKVVASHFEDDSTKPIGNITMNPVQHSVKYNQFTDKR